MRDISKLVIHCTDSLSGDAALIDAWHRARGWKRIGYHYVILNGYPTPDSLRLSRPEFWSDGVVQTGRDIASVGAHVRGHNHDSIGICLIGRHQFTHQQFTALSRLIGGLMRRFPGADVFGHYELLRTGDPPKTCPNIDMDWLRELLTAERPVRQSRAP